MDFYIKQSNKDMQINEVKKMLMDYMNSLILKRLTEDICLINKNIEFNKTSKQLNYGMFIVKMKSY